MKKNSPARKAQIAFLRKPLVLLVLTFFVALAIAGTNFNIGGRTSAASPEPTPPPKQTSDRGISQQALQQIAALNQEKESRTPAEQRISSQLLYTLKRAQGQAIANGVTDLQTGVKVDAEGYVAVDISAKVTPGLMQRLKLINAEIIASFPEYRSVTARIPLSEVESLATLPDVNFIQPKLEAQTSTPRLTGIVDSPRAPVYPSKSVTKRSLDFNYRARNVREFLTNRLNMLPVAGTVTSEGDITHRAAVARAVTGADGAGLKIGVLSDGVNSLSTAQSSGDLPASVTVLPGQKGSGDEGTAMLEIVHDLAPGAQLYFATAFTSNTSFASNIKSLRTNGCDIIIDDVSYYNETPFQDGQAATVTSPGNAGVIVQAVNDVTVGPQAGALYFSSAANSGNKNDGTAGAWEGDFASGGTAAAPLAGLEVHDFGGGNTYTALTAIDSNNPPIFLKWSDPLGGSSNDYDLYVLSIDGSTVVAASTDVQNGNDDPIEGISGSGRIVGQRIVVVKKAAAAARFLHLDTNRDQISISTSGVVYGHNAGKNTISVAATPGGTAFFSFAAIGPYPYAFNGSNKVETFSSDGPRRIFYNADGSAITPGNFLASGGQLLQKPDITAADGVSTTLSPASGFNPFFGTSAAAPHAGALAALLKSASPGSTNAQIYSAMVNGAIDIEAASVDRDSGAGIFMPLRSMNLLGVSGPASLDSLLPVSAEYVGNGNGWLDPGETGSLFITLNNIGLSNATAVSATLSTSTPGVQIVPSATQNYADIAAAVGSATNATPFAFSLNSSFPCAGTVSFTLVVNYTGGGGTQVFNFDVNTGHPTAVSTTLDVTAPPVDSTYTGITGTQTGRLTRSGAVSSCSAPKTVPALFAPTGPRQFDAYTFTASASGCTTVTLNTSGQTLFAVAYNGSGFVPSNPSTNYLADAGFSDTITQFSFNVTAGQQYTVVVHEVDPAGGVGSNYSLQVSGQISGGCQIAIPTAATVKVGGHVLTKDGKGIHKAIVTLTDMDGKTKSVKTNHFGAYSFKGLIAGQSYTLDATAKGYKFAARFITPKGDQDDLDLVAQ